MSPEQRKHPVNRHLHRRRPPSRDGRTSYRSMAFVAALAIGAVAGGWSYRNLISSYFPSDNVKALAERVDILGRGHDEFATKLQGIERLSEQLTTRHERTGSVGNCNGGHLKGAGG